MMIRILTLVVALIAGAHVAAAQEAPATPDQTVAAQENDTGAADAAPDVDSAADATPAAPAAPAEPLVIGGVDYTAWKTATARAAAILAQERPTSFALEQLRETLVTWRDRFLAAQEARAPRLSTVDAQIAALGTPPAEGASEDPLIAERRAALAQERNALRAPNILAQEAYAEANGMIAEVDSLLRARRTSELTGRDLSPANPANWAAIWDDLAGLSAAYTREASVTFTSQTRLDVLKSHWLTVGAYLLVGAALIFRGRHWVRQVARSVTTRTPRGQGVVALLLSLGQLALPYLGLTAVVAAVTSSGLAGYRVNQVIGAIPVAGFYIFVARWLAEQVFGQHARVGLPVTFTEDEKRRARRLVHAFGWGLFAGNMVLTVLDAGEVAEVTRAATILPVQILQAWSLWSFARLVLTASNRTAADLREADTDPTSFTQMIVRLVARAFQILAVAGPVLTMAGFAIAGEAVTNPAVMTLGLIGVVLILQTFVYDLYGLVTGAEEGARDALIPVLIAVILVVAALPVLALFWGVRVEELAEIWARFREGYTLGETRISPMDFLLCVVIFLIGMAATRLVQGVLRNSILPKTRLDGGAQTALISGIGYIGIALAVIFAVTAVGLDLSNLAVLVSALSVGIGFGLQNIVQNFISGIILLIERPISEGDWIEVGGKQGYVREISVRSTRIETFDRTQVIVPNADFVSGQVTNWTRGSAVGRVVLPVSVAYGSDVDKVIETLRRLGESHPMVVLNPPPSVGMVGFGADSLNFELRVIVRDVNFGGTVRSELNQAIVKAFAEEGIEMPFPQRDVHVHYVEAGAEAPKPAARPFTPPSFTRPRDGELPQKDEHADDWADDGGGHER